MAKGLTRAKFLAEGTRVCLSLSASGALVAGCARRLAADADKARPPRAPATFIARVEDIRPVYYFFKGKVKGILVRTHDGIVGYENRCTHMGSPTTLQGNTLACPWHGSTFDAATGRVLKGPASKPLTPLKLVLKDGMVLLGE